jgi:hypothetical protein
MIEWWSVLLLRHTIPLLLLLLELLLAVFGQLSITTEERKNE